jgi:hypothetical protein
LLSIKGHVEALSQADIPATLVRLLSTEESVRWKLVKVFKYMCRTSALHVRQLTQQGLVPLLCNLLSNFKEYDKVLNTVYTYCGPSFNFEFVRDILSTLGSILRAGAVDLGVNQFALLFDLSCIDRFNFLLQSLQENASVDANAWRAPSQGDRSIEEKIMDILLVVKRAHDETSPGSLSPISAMIEDIWKRYFSPRGYQLVPNQTLISLKLYYGEECRVADVSRHISFAEILSVISKKFGRPLQPSYVDEEGELVIIDSDAVWERALLRWMTMERTQQASAKLVLSDPRQPAAPPLRPPLPAAAALARPPAAFMPKLSQELDQFALSASLVEETHRVQQRALFAVLSQTALYTREQLAQVYNGWLKVSRDGGIRLEEFTMVHLPCSTTQFSPLFRASARWALRICCWIRYGRCGAAADQRRPSRRSRLCLPRSSRADSRTPSSSSSGSTRLARVICSHRRRKEPSALY